MTRFNFTFQEASPLIKYSGWVEGSSSNDSLSSSYDGSFRVTFTDKATASFTFNGTAVSIFGATRPNHGRYSVNLDQQPLFVASGWTQREIFKKSLWHSDNLPYGEHQVVLTNLPVPQPDNKFLDLDYVSIERQIGQNGDEISQNTLDDGSSAVKYVGAWSKKNDDRANAGTLHMTTVADTQAIITFNGCCLELYGHYANAPYSVTLDNQSPVNMAGFDLDPAPKFQHPRTLLYLVDGLSDGNHTVTLTNTKADVNRPFYFDYAVITTNTISDGNSQPTKGADNPVAAIVGGVVGAVTILALLILVFFLIRRWRRRRSKGERIDLFDGEPKLYNLHDNLQVQNVDSGTAPQRHNMMPVAYFSPSKRRRMEPHHEETSTSPEGTIIPREQSSTEGGSGSNGPTGSDSQSTARRQRDIQNDKSHSHTTSGENSQHLVVQEEDAGLISPEDPQTAITLPPAYNPEWHHRDDS